MSLTAQPLPERSPGSKGGGTPSWSGVPFYIGAILAVVALHVSDDRMVRMPSSWRHIALWDSNGGEVEYHLYQRRTWG